MPWGRLDDSLYDHPKLDELGSARLAGVGLWAVAISWCNRRLTDGFIPTDRIRRLGGTVVLAEKLVEARLFDRDEGGYRIHDFLAFNDSREDVERKRQQRQAAGRLGGLRRSESPSKPLSESLSKSPSGSASPRPVPSRPIPVLPPNPPDDDLWRTYQGLTRAVTIKPTVMDWLDRMETTYTGPTVAAAMVAEHATDPSPKTLLSRTERRCEQEARASEAEQAKRKRTERVLSSMQARRVEMYRNTGKWDPAWGEPPESAA